MNNLFGKIVKNIWRKYNNVLCLKRPYTITSDDIMIVSYPKSGNTWLRFMIGNYINNNQCDFTNYHLLVPDIHRNPGDCNRLHPPRFIKSHHSFTSEYHNVVYLARDGRDVAVSMFYHLKKYGKLAPDTSFENFISKFNVGPIPKFGVWADHVNNWINNAPQNFLIIKYEELHMDPILTLKKILQFSDIKTDKEKIVSAVLASRFKNMKRAEIEQHNRCDTLIGTDENIRSVRNGKVGEWRNYFSEKMNSNFCQIHGTALNALNYNIKQYHLS